jgi:hypothetical protein
MQRQQCNEQSVTYPGGSRQCRPAKHLSFADLDETGFDQAFGQNQPIGL